MPINPTPEEARSSLEAAAQAQAGLRQSTSPPRLQLALASAGAGIVVASRGIPDPLAWLRWVIIAIVVIALLALILANPSKRAVKRGLKHEARDLRYSVAALIAPVVFVMGVLVALELIASSAAQGAPWWAFGIGGLAVAAVFYPLGRWNWRILGKPRDPEV